MMLDIEQIRNFPDDPGLRFLALVKALRMELESSQDGKRIPELRQYVAHIRAFTDNYDIGKKYNDPPVGDKDFISYFQNFKRSVDQLEIDLTWKIASKDSAIQTDEFELAENYKLEIQKHLNKVRKIVLVVEIEERLRESILGRLNALVAEVDKSRSDVGRFLDSYLEITAAISEGAENLEPAAKFMERVAGIFGIARKKNDTKLLPGSEEIKMLEGPDEASDEDDEADAEMDET